LKVTMMDAALKYAEANIPVMPLHWICEGGLCSCKQGVIATAGKASVIYRLVQEFHY